MTHISHAVKNVQFSDQLGEIEFFFLTAQLMISHSWMEITALVWWDELYMKLVFVSEFILNLKDVLVQPRGPLRFFCNS